MHVGGRIMGWRTASALLSLGLTATALLLAGSPAAASPGWELILDRPTPDFGGIDFVSEYDGWMTAGAGLLHTTDGGATWTEAARLIAADVDFADEEHGWLVGEGGTIYATADGGETWAEQESGSVVHLTDVLALSATEAWAIGQWAGYSDVIKLPIPSVLLHTTDGGLTWQQIALPEGTWFDRVTFAGDSGWLAGDGCAERPSPGYCELPARDGGLLLHTPDGGNTWSLVETELPARVKSLDFVDETHGWLVGHACEEGAGCRTNLYRSTDGARTWSLVPLADLGDFEQLDFVDPASGWLLTSRREAGDIISQLWTTTDGGETWSLLSEITRGRVSSPRKLVAADEALYAIGRDLALRSTEGGVVLREMKHPALRLSHTVFVDQRAGYAVNAGDLYETSDAGRSWQRIGPLPPGSESLTFLETDVGFTARASCCDPSQPVEIFRTVDGGGTWTLIYSTSAFATPTVRSLEFQDARRGWLVLDDGVIRTDDGGDTWFDYPLPGTTPSLIRATSADPATTWAVAFSSEYGDGDNTLLKSDDGGRTWRQVPIPDDQSPQLVTFVDALHGWYLAYVCAPGVCDQRLFRTDDGGDTWTGYHLSDRTYPLQMLFVDPLNGWLSGTVCEDLVCTGAILHSADGGRTWKTQHAGDHLQGQLFFVDVETGWFLPIYPIGVGGGPPQRTLLYHTTDGGGGPIGRVILPEVGQATAAAANPLGLVVVLLAIGGGLALAAPILLRRRA
jgi:photosystem II stability/assembly factor-like uncharacterized protein